MSRLEKDDPNLNGQEPIEQEQEGQEQDPKPLSDEEFEEKKKKEDQIIGGVLDSVLTSFHLFLD